MTLIFLCPAIHKAIGGVKVIGKQAVWMLLLGKSRGFSAVVRHPDTRFFRLRWLDSQEPLKRAFFKRRWMGQPSFFTVPWGVECPTAQGGDSQAVGTKASGPWLALTLKRASATTSLNSMGLNTNGLPT